ncbi:unnamed protein product [Owenia fusiformis]|uniref:Uncharacterized protein n=1 Tax=Owenia fusiformis TaxID=6347 RepID=A0A8J1UBF6_OWEFU|nr:unnamed protein product [Owenia fusiformis]
MKLKKPFFKRISGTKILGLLLIQSVVLIYISLFLETRCSNKQYSSLRNLSQRCVKNNFSQKINITMETEHKSKKDTYYDISSEFNETKRLLVPNIVHYIWMQSSDTIVPKKLTFTFLNALSFLSVHKHWKPETIYLHGNVLPTGNWWETVRNNVTNIVHVYHDERPTIYGNKVRYKEHMADILRLEILQEYGGVYIDTDVIAIQSYEPLLKYDVTLPRDSEDQLANGIIFAKPHAPFLKIWHETYKTYSKWKKGTNAWAFHSVQTPYKLSKIFPHLVHIEGSSLIGPRWYEPHKLFKGQYRWMDNFSIHVWKGKSVVPPEPGLISNLPDQSTLQEVMEYIWYDRLPKEHNYTYNDVKGKDVPTDKKINIQLVPFISNKTQNLTYEN